MRGEAENLICSLCAAIEDEMRKQFTATAERAWNNAATHSINAGDVLDLEKRVAPKTSISDKVWRNVVYGQSLNDGAVNRHSTGTEMEPNEPKQTAANDAETPENP